MARLVPETPKLLIESSRDNVAHYWMTSFLKAMGFVIHETGEEFLADSKELVMSKTFRDFFLSKLDLPLLDCDGNLGPDLTVTVMQGQREQVRIIFTINFLYFLH